MNTSFRETKIGRIPADWDAVRIGDIKYSLLLTGGTPNTKIPEYWGGNIPWMNSGDIHSKYITNVNGRITDEGMRNSAAKILPRNSVLVALNGQGRTKGTVAINRIELTCNQSIAAYVLNQIEFDPLYVFHYLSSQYRKLRTLAGDDDRAGLNLRLLREITMPRPPLPEQRQIAEILSTIDETIDKTDAIIQETQQLKKGLMQKLFTQGIGHTRFKETKIGRIPEEWDITTLGQVLTNIQSGVSRNLSPIDIGVPVIRSTNIQDNKLALDDLRYWFWDDTQGVDLRNYILDDGDILVNFINSVAQIGKCCIFPRQARNFIFTTNILRAKSNDELISNIYFLMFSETIAYQSQISTITKPAVNQASFTHGDFRKIKIPLPRKQEQDRIVEILSGVDSKIEKEQAFRAELERLKKGLMQVLLTGKIRVKV